MIHIFNRAELLTTSNLEKLSGVRDALDAKGIDYKVKSKTSLGSTTARNGRAGTTYGAVPMSDALYTVYVRRDDLDRAKNLI
ncbi:MAG: hypothetical protein E7433_06305 [Ruminococcaceae bacterium]|nr:hypothetical protein [Oscillospiraceae bacterium]